MGENKPNSWHPSVEQYIGKVIDQYVLVEPLGQGGMGLIFKAEQRRIKRFVAVKLLSPDHMSNDVSIKRLQREATSMANLKHPHIATLFDMVISKEAQPYLIMELIEGTSLKTILRAEGKMTPLRAVNIFLQVADAMDYAHTNGVMHRDLKPDNVMLTTEFRTVDYVKILDFGIAKSVEVPGVNVEALTHQGQMMGSPLYMSPEQCVGKGVPDLRTDIYSLGVIMYECLTGDVPIKGHSFVETAWLKTTELPAPFPAELKLSPELETLTMECLASEPDKRPQTMRLVREKLEEIRKQLEGVETGADKPFAVAPAAAPGDPAAAAVPLEVALPFAPGDSAAAVASEVALAVSPGDLTEAAQSAVAVSAGDTEKAESQLNPVAATMPSTVVIEPPTELERTHSGELQKLPKISGALIPPALASQMDGVTDLETTLNVKTHPPAPRPGLGAQAPRRASVPLVIGLAVLAVGSGAAFMFMSKPDAQTGGASAPATVHKAAPSAKETQPARPAVAPKQAASTTAQKKKTRRTVRKPFAPVSVQEAIAPRTQSPTKPPLTAPDYSRQIPADTTAASEIPDSAAVSSEINNEEANSQKSLATGKVTRHSAGKSSKKVSKQRIAVQRTASVIIQQQVHRPKKKLFQKLKGWTNSIKRVID